jgi:aminopeptidase N
MKQSVARLFDGFKPKNYTLSLSLDPVRMTFEGRVIITGQKTGRPSKRLTFHQKDLNIISAVVTRHDKKGDEQIRIDRINTQKKYAHLRLHSASLLYPGAYTVTITFSGTITDKMNGIYPCYFEAVGKKQKLLATQFESNFAHSVFPCIDEPAAKATFDLTVTSPEEDIVLSNMPAKKEKTTRNRKTTVFETTPIMSTYLLAFISGNMHYVESKTKDGIIVRSWSSVAQPKKSLQYSVDEAVKTLEFFTDYFQTPYPLPKCDQVALPDFDAGAMENWGLITYREIALLTDADNRSISGEQYVSLVIAHELSHQWFGNLVTMAWWDDLWLNESFASLMEHIALDAIHPDWQQWEFYTSSDVISTSSRDVYSDIQPVAIKITDPELIDTLFDPGIVYAKGGRLIKMLRDYIGDEDFRKGLKHYFTQHAYANATRDDLWRSLGEASKQNLNALMDPWLLRPGMPLVSIDQTGNKLLLSQERFLLDKKPDSTLWPIPLLARTPISPSLFSSISKEVKLNTSDYVLLNQHASGHYFVRYLQKAHREYLNQAIAQQTIPTEARINILNDSYMLARRGDISLTEGLDTSITCRNEPRDAVWSMMSRVLAAAAQLTEGDDDVECQLKDLRIQLAASWYKKLGWDDKKDDNSNTKQLRHTALALTLSGEDKSAIAEALMRYKTAKNLDSLPAETRNSILAIAIRHGDKENVDSLLGLYESASPDMQQDIAVALASTKDPKTAAHIFKKALGPKGFVRPQDVLRWIAYFLRNRYTREFTWQFMTSEWEWLKGALDTSKSFDYLPTYCAGVITTKEWAKKYHEFFAPLESMKAMQRNILVGYSDIEARIAWRNRDEENIKTWLDTRSR